MPVPASTDRSRRFRLSPRAWWLLGGGFGLGLLIFLAMWWHIRSSGDFYRAEGKQTTDDGQVFEPLPAPASDGSQSASGLSEAAEAARNQRPAPAPVAAPEPPHPPEAQADDNDDDTEPARSTATLAPGSEPVPIHKVRPVYPADAARNSETGKVVVRIEVDTDGTPADVSIARSSRSRSLDRAALEAARQWRFRPAQADGRPFQASVEVPFEFTLDER